MYRNIYNYVPFQHNNVEVKNNIINFGRNQDKSKPEGAFSAVLIYANLVDYLAINLLENLDEMISIETFTRFGGVFHHDNSGKKQASMPLGRVCHELNLFEFPSKLHFLDCLKKFNTLRIGLIHKLMQFDPTDTTRNLDDDINKIQEIAEDILLKYNAICGGITNAWNAVHQQPTSNAAAV